MFSTVTFLILLIVVCPQTATPECLNSTELNIARDDWFENRTSAQDAYGLIQDWEFCYKCSFSKLFQYQTSFNEDISGWDAGGVTNMAYMFDNATIFNNDLSGWNVTNVESMHKMFHEVTTFNQDLAAWDVSKVTNMSWMFDTATKLNKNLSGWDVGKVADMSKMFHEAESFNQNLSEWDVSKVTKMKNMFNEASSFNLCLAWDVRNDTVTDAMFDNSNGTICTNTSNTPSAELTQIPSMRPSVNLKPETNANAEVLSGKIVIFLLISTSLLVIILTVRQCFSNFCVGDQRILERQDYDDDGEMLFTQDYENCDESSITSVEVSRSMKMNEPINSVEVSRSIRMNEASINRGEEGGVSRSIKMNEASINSSTQDPSTVPLLQGTGSSLGVGEP